MSTVIDVVDVTLRRDRALLLDHVTWKVSDEERWVVIGPNGAGKTTLMQVISANLHPTSGEVKLLDEKLGRVDVFELRPRIGVSSSVFEAQIPEDETVLNVVMSASYAVFGRWNEEYEAVDIGRAVKLMTRMKVHQLAGRLFGTLSEGERQRTKIARALMADPEILILDEPTAGLDLAGREVLLETLTEITCDQTSPCTILVTHHVEEIPTGVTHALFLKRGHVVAKGPIRTVMTPEVLTRTFDLPLKIEEVDGRWRAQGR